MYIDSLWLVIGIVTLAYIAYRIGYYFGDINGYYRYDKEIQIAEKKGDVIFPNAPSNDDI